MYTPATGKAKPVEEEVITPENFYEQMLMFFPGYALISFGAVVVPTIFITLLFALPWLDRGPNYSALKRPFAAIVGILIIIVVLLNMLLALSRIMNFPG